MVYPFGSTRLRWWPAAVLSAFYPAIPPPTARLAWPLPGYREIAQPQGAHSRGCEGNGAPGHDRNAGAALSAGARERAYWEQERPGYPSTLARRETWRPRGALQFAA